MRVRVTETASGGVVYTTRGVSAHPTFDDARRHAWSIMCDWVLATWTTASGRIIWGWEDIRSGDEMCCDGSLTPSSVRD